MAVRDLVRGLLPYPENLSFMSFYYSALDVAVIPLPIGVSMKLLIDLIIAIPA